MPVQFDAPRPLAPPAFAWPGVFARTRRSDAAPAIKRLDPANPDRTSGAAGTVAFEAVGKEFKAVTGTVSALEDVSLTIERGRIFGIIGRSGAGKSTLLRLVNRLERPTSGRVLVGGIDVGALDKPDLTRLRRRIGMIFQHFNLLSAKTVAQNVALPLKIAGVPQTAIDAKVDELLEIVGLSAKRDVYPAKLSGGQKQRVGIARALVHDPDILLCDEATSALDPETTQAILGLLKTINQRLGVTVILITHEMGVIRDIADDVAVLERGRLVETGPVWSVFGAPEAEATKALLATLVHDLPADLADRLGDRTKGARTVYFGVHFSGREGSGQGGPDRRGSGADLAAIVAAVGEGARLVHGGLDRLQGHAQGRLVIGAALIEGALPEETLLRLRRLAHSAEILGYADDLD